MEKITVSLILEVLGRPPENVIEALTNLLEKMSKEKGVSIKKKEFHDPIKIEGSQDLYTSFVEIEAELDSLAQYFTLIFAYMPSHIELVNPEKITLQNTELNDLANALTQRLHTYDGIAKNYLIEREFVFTKLKEIAPDVLDKIVEYLKSKSG